MQKPDLAHPLYDITKTYLENAEEGPFFSGQLLTRAIAPKSQWAKVLGFDVISKIGVPAGPLLNARWIDLALRLGFDIVTYKTIRSKEHPAHPLPNMIFVDGSRFLQAHEEGNLIRSASMPESMSELSLTNSFGIPSRDPDYLMKDIALAMNSLKDGQLLIVSVVGTPRSGEDYFSDFAAAAHLAIEAGAPVIEADLSCPNLSEVGGSLYTDPEAIFEICKKIKAVIHFRPLILKVGMILDEKKMRQVARAAARGGAQAIAGINTLSMQVVDENGDPALGAKRRKAGVCGKPIRHAALQFIRLARSVIDDEKLDLELFGTGGVTEYNHFDDLFEAGADVAMSALGMMWDPLLALRYHQFGKKLWIQK